MATFRERIQVIIDATTKGARDELNKLTKEAHEADRAVEGVGKQGVGLGGRLRAAGGGIKGFASGLATSFGPAGVAGAVGIAGAAIGKFAIDSVNRFKDLALAVNDFRTATGTTLDEASRFVEVGKW